MLPQLLRLDDVGASSKQYEQYAKFILHGRTFIASGHNPLNWFSFKRTRLLKGWGPYSEMSADDWGKIFSILRQYQAKLTIGVTAAWVERDGSLTPFDKKFPNQVGIIKEAVAEGLVEIANHGLTHCVLRDNQFKPRTFSSNRVYHREFWGWLPFSVHREHIFRSQEILHHAFNTRILTFIPSGHVFSDQTLKYAAEAGIKYLSANHANAPTGQQQFGLRFISTPDVIAFHDREIVLAGVEWLEQLLKKSPYQRYATIAEYAQMINDAK